MNKIFLSPSRQSGNKYAAGNTNEKVQCEKITTAAAAALERCGFWVFNAAGMDSYAERVDIAMAEKVDLYVPVHTNARRNLWTAILELGPDYLYADTDSVKVVNGERHADYFKRYNENIVAKLDAACQYHGLDPELTRPKNKAGKIKQLGVWDYEGRYSRFKTLGAKRYLTEDGSGLHLTVAGLGKSSAVKYLLFKYHDSDGVFQAFSDDLEIPAEYERDGETLSATGKNTHTYIDEPVEGMITDYQGHTVHYKELSAIHLEPAAYSLSLSEEYVRFLFDIRSIESV